MLGNTKATGELCVHRATLSAGLDIDGGIVSIRLRSRQESLRPAKTGASQKMVMARR